MSEQTRPTARMRVTIEGYYDAPIDPNVYEGTTDPHEMARIDARNPLDAILGLMGEPQVRIEPAPIPACQRAYEVVEQRLDVSGVLDGEPPLRRAAIVASVVAALRREGLLRGEEDSRA